MSEKIQKKIYQFDNRITPPKFIDSSNTALEAARYFLAENGNREISTELGFFAYEKPLNLTPNRLKSSENALLVMIFENLNWIPLSPRDLWDKTAKRSIIMGQTNI
jgi:hypothetical protein